MSETETNHRFIAGYTHDECACECEDDVCLRSEWDRIHFPPGDDWDEMYSQVMTILRLAGQYWATL